MRVPQPPPPHPPVDTFDVYLVADVTRLLLAVLGVFMVLLCMRVAWLRARTPKGDPLRERSPWALLSYASFAAIPTVHALGNLGHRPDVPLIGLFAVGLGFGVVAAFGQVTLQLWTRRPHPDPAHREVHR